MFNIILERLRQKHRTHRYPKAEVRLPGRYRGRPQLDSLKCEKDCQQCIEICPTKALIRMKEAGPPVFDLGRCLFCGDCALACPAKAINFTTDYRLATSTLQNLVMQNNELQLAKTLNKKMLELFGRSLKLRQVSAGGCNACEADINVLNTLVFDLQRFGVQIVASPRHADGILVTGPVAKSMQLALQKTHDAISSPKLVIVCGTCSISGVPFEGDAVVPGALAGIMPVDLFIPGCPPHPMTILDGLLRVLGKLQ